MKKILTLVFDGFGIREEEKGNAIKAAQMRAFENFWNTYPHTTLYASEERVGLLKGQMGNSEVGHMTIGAGHILKSNMDKIGDFFHNAEDSIAFQNLISNPNRNVHLMGLCSDGKIHGDISHFLSMYEVLVKHGFKNIYFHLITDGRDTPVDVAYNYIQTIQNKINEYGIGKIVTIAGRYYAMDRDSNYNRTKAYYDLVTQGVGNQIIDIARYLNGSYEKNITDEFIKPLLLSNDGLIRNEDALIWLNFRTDRSKQILSAFASDNFNGFPLTANIKPDIYTFYMIDKAIKTHVFIEERPLENPLGIYLSKLGLKQARVAESEKYPHVTYFFDGGYEGKIDGVDKFHIPSPQVATYDLKPEMSVVDVTHKIVECMEKDYDFIFANLVNPDMVGHTGSMEAATKACMAVDVCLSKILEAAETNFYTVILTADHGNADTMFNPDGSICTTHSLAKTPFIIGDTKVKLKDDGDLSNVAPTILDYMDIAIPSQMTSESLLIKD